jgi:hypothetical protein
MLSKTSLRAELSGSTICSAVGHVAIGQTPVLALCRELIATGHNPDQPLEVYRGGTLALRIRSIGEGARLTVSEEADRPPRFKRWKPRNLGEGSPPIAQNRAAVS